MSDTPLDQNQIMVTAIDNHLAFLDSDRCIEAAWAEAINRQPEHLTTAVIDWFQTTRRFDVVQAEWLEGQQ